MFIAALAWSFAVSKRVAIAAQNSQAQRGALALDNMKCLP
jgi:hypothetical protein